MVTTVTATAPPKSFSYSSKANALKEVETWASELGGNARDSAVRSVGQIVDNVTEGRLLRTKVTELSKERYKFIIQSDYDKKFFVETQQRKLKAMPDLLRGVDVEYWLSKKPRRRARTAQQLQLTAAAAAMPANAAPVEATDRRFKADGGGGGGGGWKATPPHDDASRRESVTPAPACARRVAPRRVATSLGVAPVAAAAASSSPSLPSTSAEWAARASNDLSQPSQQSSQRRRQTLASISVSPSYGGGAAAAAAGSDDNALAQASAAAGDRRNLRPAEGGGRRAGAVRYAGRRAVADIRYVKLEGSLTGKYSCEFPAEVSAIVDACRALHVPSAAGTRYTKPKLSGHIAEYLRLRKLIV